MNVALWILQVLLALHTVMGALWKLGNSEQAVPSLQALPHAAWLALAAIELACAVGLVVPALRRRRLGVLAPVAALVIAGEMLLFSGLHLASGSREHGEVAYWGVVAALCAFLAWGRLSRRPI